MPTSAEENKLPVMNLLKQLKCKNILELGVGYGQFGPKIRIEIPGSRLFGIEIFEPYFSKIPVNCYERLFNDDIRTFDYENKMGDVDLDAILIIDVLEHLTKQDALELLGKLEKISKHIIISVPIIDVEQGEFLGNKWEEHKYQWKINEMLELNYSCKFAGKIIGIFHKQIKGN